MVLLTTAKAWCLMLRIACSVKLASALVEDASCQNEASMGGVHSSAMLQKGASTLKMSADTSGQKNWALHMIEVVGGAVSEATSKAWKLTEAELKCIPSSLLQFDFQEMREEAISLMSANATVQVTDMRTGPDGMRKRSVGMLHRSANISLTAKSAASHSQGLLSPAPSGVNDFPLPEMVFDTSTLPQCKDTEFCWEEKNSVWTSDQLAPLTGSDKWAIGDTWKLSLEATSDVTETKSFGFGGGTGFLFVDIPPGGPHSLSVTDVVKRGSSTRFFHRGRGHPGKIVLSDVILSKVATPRTMSQGSAKSPVSRPPLIAQSARSTASISKGGKVFPLTNTSGFAIGQEVVIAPGTPEEEYNRIIGFGSLILQYPFLFDHPLGALILGVTDEEVLGPDLLPVSEAATAPLDASGFLAMTSLCCPWKMETFFNRLLSSMGLEVCSKAHIQGLMHWFTCVPNMDFQYMVDVIAKGNPCKYWAPKVDKCPELSSACAGHWCR